MKLRKIAQIAGIVIGIGIGIGSLTCGILGEKRARHEEIDRLASVRPSPELIHLYDVQRKLGIDALDTKRMISQDKLYGCIHVKDVLENPNIRPKYLGLYDEYLSLRSDRLIDEHKRNESLKRQIEEQYNAQSASYIGWGLGTCFGGWMLGSASLVFLSDKNQKQKRRENE